MSKVDVLRAWKDPAYRANLSEADLGSIPAHPAGLIELTDEELGFVAGGRTKCTSSNTSTGGSGCSCTITTTANSGGGGCMCHCDKSRVASSISISG